MPIPSGARLVIATGNVGKLREMRELLASQRLEVVDLSGLPAVEFPEEGADYASNAVAKARAAASRLGEWALADDSGLEVEGLGGAPGPYSARYGGAGLDDAGRVRHLLAELAARPGASRRARFVCWVAAVAPDGAVFSAVGECPGVILAGPRGQGGFGYDPIFRPDGHTRTLAELGASAKNALSHRARAVRALFKGAPSDLACQQDASAPG